jgi:acetyl esterase/lipase
MTGAIRLCLAGVLAALALAGCTLPAPQGAAPLRYRDPVFSSISETQNIQYGAAPDLNGNIVPLMLDLYEPTGDTVTQRPAIVWVHGGGFCCGDKSSGVSPTMAQNFAHYGYVTVSINYRLLAPPGCTGFNLTQACTNAAVAAEHDAQAAVRWLRANATTYGIDPTRIGIGGESAGAITATAVGLDPQDPGSSGNPGYSSAVDGFMSLSGGVPSGTFVAGPGDAAGLLFSGTADPIVPFAWSAQTAQAMVSNGIGAVLEPLVGAGHVPYYPPYQAQIDSQTDYFFYDFLDAADAQGSTPAAARMFHRELQTLARRFPRLATRLRRAALAGRSSPTRCVAARRRIARRAGTCVVTGSS